MRNRLLRADVRLHDCNGNFLHCISHAKGNAMVNEGRAIAVRSFSYGVAKIVRYQELKGETPSKSQPTPAAMTPADARVAMAAAYRLRQSSTARLPEYDTLLRDSKRQREIDGNPHKPVENFMERSQNKIRMWEHVPLWNPKRQPWKWV